MNTTNTGRMRQKLLMLAVVALCFGLLTPAVAGKDFLIQNQAQSPLFLVNGTSGNIGVNTLNPAYPLTVDGTARVNGDIDLSSQLNNISGFFQSTCTGSNVVQEVWKNGSYKCVDINTYDTDTDTDNQTLSEVLVRNNTANMSIDMAGNEITRIGGLAGRDIVNSTSIIANAVGGSELASGSVTNDSLASFGSFTIQDLTITNTLSGSQIISTTNLEQAAVTADKLTIGAVNESHLASSVTGNGISGGGGSQLSVSAGYALSQTSSGLRVDDSVVALTNQSETVSSAWWFRDNVTVQGNLDVWGNITNTDVQNLRINGSLLPQQGYDATFDVGGSSRRWQNLYISNNALINGSIHIDGNVDGIDLDNAGNGITTDANDGYTIDLDGGTLSLSGTGLKAATAGIDADQIAGGAVNATHFAGSVPGNHLTVSGGALNVENGSVDADTVDSLQASQFLRSDANDAVGGNISFGDTYWITNLKNPVNAQDAATKDYVDTNDADTDDQNLKEVLVRGNEANTSINMSGNNITDVREIQDFFSNACSNDNEAVKRVWPNGSYVCETIPEDTGTEGLAETLAAANFADGTDIVMNGSANLNMSGNNITNVTAIDGGGDQVEVKDNVNMSGNNVTDTKSVQFGGGMELVRSGDDLCLGDQCNG